MSARGQRRADALHAAVQAAGDSADDLESHHRRRQQILHDADAFYAWLIEPVRLTLTFGPLVDQATGSITPTTTGDTPMANLQLGDSQQVTATAVPLDADGEPTTDTLTWTSSSATAVTLQPSTDTLSCMILGGVPETNVTITATDSLGNTTSGELDVVAGEAASLSLSFGPVTAKATPAAPATDTTPAETPAA